MEYQLSISYFMERTQVSGPVLPPPAPTTSKRARKECNERHRSRRLNLDVGQENRRYEAAEKLKKAMRESAKKAELRREKARQAPTKKPIKLMEGQGTLPSFGFPTTKPRAQVVKDDT